MADPLLRVDGLTVEYWTRKGKIRAVDDVSFHLGNPKFSASSASQDRENPPLACRLSVWFLTREESSRETCSLNGKDVLKLKKEELRNLRGMGVCYVFQDPMTSLNPVKKIGDHFAEMIQTHEPKVTKKEAFERAEKASQRRGDPG